VDLGTGITAVWNSTLSCAFPAVGSS